MRRSRLGLWYALLAASIPPGAVFAGDVARVAATDMETIRMRLRARLLEKATVDAGSLRKLTERQKADGSWPDIDYADRSRTNFVPVRHLYRLRTMALAHELPSSALRGRDAGQHPKVPTLRGDAKLKGAIKRGLDFWARRRPRSGNWWNNHIGCPRAMADVLLLMADDLPPGTFQAAMETVRESYRTGWIINTGQNLVWKAGVAMVQGCLERDEKVLRWAVDSIRRTVGITGKEGVQADFSFHQHGPQLYSGGYGASFVVDCSEFAVLVHGTAFDLSDEQRDVLCALILDGHQWMVRQGVFDYGALGRGISRPGEVRRNAKAGALRRAAENMAKIKTPRDAEFRGLLARLRGEKHAKLLIGNRHFWRSDFMVHHREGWYASVKMASKRVTATESGNGEGLRNWYMGAGVNFVIRKGDEYEDVFPVWDWRKLPGTTVEESDAKLPECSWGRGAKGKTSFVGGVSDGVYGLAAYDYVKDGIRARKSWFFFDDEFVCLGAGITATGNGRVCTTLNQCRLRGDVFLDDGTEVSRLGRGGNMFENPRFIHHDGIGYVFLEEGGDVEVHLGPRAGSWHDINRNQSKGKVKLDVFSLWITHPVGTGPPFGPWEPSYAYAVVPGMDVRKLRAYVRRPPVRVVKNARGLQAVRHERVAIAGLAFYEAGEIEAAPGLTVSVDRPCLVLVHTPRNGLRLTVSDPENEPATVHVDVGRRLSGEGTRWLDDRNVTRVTFDLPGGLQAGRSVLRDLRYSR